MPTPHLTRPAPKTRSHIAFFAALLCVVFAAPSVFADGLLATADASGVSSVSSGGASRIARESRARNLGHLVTYRRLAGPETLGRLGVDVGYATIRLADAEGEGSIGRLHARLGLTKSIDVGASVSVDPQTDARTVAGEVSWALLHQRGPVPGILLTSSFTRTEGLRNGDVEIFDTSAIIGYSIFGGTLYTGMGTRFVHDCCTADGEYQAASYGIAGARYEFGPVNFTAQTDVGSTTTASLRIGVSI